MPKGVMWRQHDLYLRLAGGGLLPPPADMAALRAFVSNAPLRLSTLVAPPLMHGTGWFTAMIAWLTGGTVLMLDDPKRFDPADLWGVVTREKPTSITIVGDSFAKPMVRELAAGGARYDFSSVKLIASSGVMWSEETKQALLAANPQRCCTTPSAPRKRWAWGSRSPPRRAPYRPRASSWGPTRSSSTRRCARSRPRRA
jgi:acyl-CoA synthetase (AMP-forming)/AMP-acid ligase II